MTRRQSLRENAASHDLPAIASSRSLVEASPEQPVANDRAVKEMDRDLHLGYVPDPLVDYVADVMRHKRMRLTVLQANPPQTNPYLRLLLRLEEELDSPFPFDEIGWRTVY